MNQNISYLMTDMAQEETWVQDNDKQIDESANSIATYSALTEHSALKQ